MAPALLLLAASALSPPIPFGNPSLWLTGEDYPMFSIYAEEEGTTRFRIVVSPQGTPMSCTKTVSSGFPRLDAQTCALMMRRARFKPARGRDAAAAYGAFDSFTNWSIPGGKSRASEVRVDMMLTVARLPPHITPKTRLGVAIDVDPAGKITDCALLDADAAALEATLCREVRALWKPRAVVAGSDGAVRSIQSLQLGFELGR